MFIEKLTEKEFECLAKALFTNYLDAKLHVFNVGKNLILTQYTDRGPGFTNPEEEVVIVSDFNAEHGTTLLEGAEISNLTDLSKTLRKFMYEKFGEVYISALKKHLEEIKKHKIKELENKHNKVIEELTK